MKLLKQFWKLNWILKILLLAIVAELIWVLTPYTPEQKDIKLSSSNPTSTPTETPVPTSLPSEIRTVTPSKKPSLTPASIQTKQIENMNIPSISNETIGQKNAVKKAKSYLSYSAFSHDGLVAQLEYDKFSHIDAIYGADNSSADWNEQAAKKAKSYMEYSAFSRDGLIEQLRYDKFTQEQSVYGVNAVGL